MKPRLAAAPGVPEAVARVLHGVPALSGLEVLLSMPEHQVPLPGGSRPSQTDLWVLARSDSGLVSIAVEGKVNESFGPTLAEWLVDASDGKRTRLDSMCKLLQIDTPPPSTRYQLLHRTASAVLEARRFLAPQAIMLVHSFSHSDTSLAEYQSFLGLLGGTGGANQATAVGVRSGVNLHLAWVRSHLPKAGG